VKELLAHSSITTTQRYLHSQAEQKRAAVNSLALAGQKYGFGLEWQKKDKSLLANEEVDAATLSYLSS
jgi:hypothetical protein